MNHKKSIEQHVKDGTYRPSIHGNKDKLLEVEPISKIPKPASYIGKYGKLEYHRLTTQLQKSNLLCNCDLGLLELACYEYNAYREMIDELRELNGGSYKGAFSNYVKGKNIQTVIIPNEMRKSYKAYCDTVFKFGISPVERNRIQVNKNEDDKDSALGAI
jgi:P27 family predicted phage terminase small subunit